MQVSTPITDLCPHLSAGGAMASTAIRGHSRLSLVYLSDPEQPGILIVFYRGHTYSNGPIRAGGGG